MSRPLSLVAAVLAASLVFVACGKSEEPKRSARGNPADPVGTEGAYLSLEPLTYQVQISRQLNPRDIEDRAYLEGLPPAQRRLRPNETWFGVFLRVANDGDHTAKAAGQFRIFDTERNMYRPVPLGAGNAFAYRALPVGPGRQVPDPNSVAGQGSIQGTVVVFKLRYDTLQNRPVVFEIVDDEARRAEVDLDI